VSTMRDGSTAGPCAETSRATASRAGAIPKAAGS
jgi:hypothetical protein